MVVTPRMTEWPSEIEGDKTYTLKYEPTDIEVYTMYLQYRNNSEYYANPITTGDFSSVNGILKWTVDPKLLLFDQPSQSYRMGVYFNTSTLDIFETGDMRLNAKALSDSSSTVVSVASTTLAATSSSTTRAPLDLSILSDLMNLTPLNARTTSVTSVTSAASSASTTKGLPTTSSVGSSSASTSPSPSQTPSTSPSPTTAATTNTNTKTSTTLSTGALAGIIISVIIGALIIASIAFFLTRKRYRIRAKEGTAGDSSLQFKQELDGYEVRIHEVPPKEMDARQRVHEMEHVPVPVELPVRPVELPVRYSRGTLGGAK